MPTRVNLCTLQCHWHYCHKCPLLKGCNIRWKILPASDQQSNCAKCTVKLNRKVGNIKLHSIQMLNPYQQWPGRLNYNQSCIRNSGVHDSFLLAMLKQTSRKRCFAIWKRKSQFWCNNVVVTDQYINTLQFAVESYHSQLNTLMGMNCPL